MAKTVYIGGMPVRFADKDEVAQGGEAIIYKIPPDYVNAFKLYKQPGHPDFAGNPMLQESVKRRLDTLQEKLRNFPKGLPSQVVTPINFGTNSSGTRIEGYSMRLLTGATPLWSYSQVEFRERGGVNPNDVVGYLRKLHGMVSGIHGARVVLADFNSLNVLIVGGEVFYVDADSMQWGNYLSPLYTLTYVDPTLCKLDPFNGIPTLALPHNINSDWYAYSIMLMESMVYAGPYSGTYRPRKAADRINPELRPLKRVTVWHKEVIYPKPALPLRLLPDDLNAFFMDEFEKDRRGEFPLTLIDNLRWTKCTSCGTLHARAICPECAQAAPAAIKQKVIQRGKVTATRIFPSGTASGVILIATAQGKEFYFLYHDGESLNREDGTTVSRSKLDTQVRYRIKGDSTLFAKNGRLVITKPGARPEVISVDSFGNLPMFDANLNHYYWISGGSLYRDGAIGPEFIGNVLENLTLFWVGSRFGFGFWRAGDITTGFQFDTELRGINDNVQLPALTGQLLNSTATFAGERVWFFTTTQSGGKTINRCFVIRSDGHVEATAEAQNGDDSWLGVITGKCAVGSYLLSPTDGGIVRVELSGGKIAVTREFPDTEPFIHAGSYLFPHQDGLVTITGKEIYVLKIS